MRKNISETIREEMKDLYDTGLINETTMRKFDPCSKQDVIATRKSRKGSSDVQERRR